MEAAAVALGSTPDDEPVTAPCGAGDSVCAREHPSSVKKQSGRLEVRARLRAGIVSPRAVYLATRKIPDGIWNRFVCRPIAAVLVDAIQHTRVTPNQITLLSALVAGSAVVLLAALPGYGALLSAIAIYEASYVLDCADGMLARLRGIQSTRGHLLDFLMDELKAFAMLSAASFRLFRDSADARWLIAGLFGLCALASGTALTTFLRRPEVALPAGSAAAPSLLRRAISLVEAMGKFVVHYPSYIWLAALLGRLDYYVVPYVIANALYAARALLGVARRFARE